MDNSGVRALHLAAGINVGGHYKWHFFLSLSSLFRHIAMSPRRGCHCQVSEFGDPPYPPTLCNFWAEKGGILKICPMVPKLNDFGGVGGGV
jgi:hypothetical protein